MALFIRLVRSLFAFGVIFSSYMLQLALARVFSKKVGRERVLPKWIAERRKRVDAKNAKRLLNGMLSLRGVFIKLGQGNISIMGGFLPRVYAKELEQLQDAVPPHRFSEVEKSLEKSFGHKADAIFASIEKEPIAAASLGQVHVARLKDGKKVAVKFLYPNIRAIIAIDLRVLRLAVLVYKRFVPVAKIERIHASLVDLLRRETDYLHEAACMEQLAANFADDAGLAFPEVVHDLTTKDVLTMTFMKGVKITKLERLAAMGIDKRAIAVRLVQTFFKMLFVDRFFHADPHPGNFLIEKDERAPEGFKLVVLDFGAVSEAKDELIDGMIDILRGVTTEDDKLVVKGFRAMGFVTEGGDEALLEKTVRRYFSKLLKIKDRTPAALMRAKPEQLKALADPEMERGELQNLMRSVEYPEDWFYVERACIVAFWLAAQIDPSLDTIQIGFPYVMPLIAKRAIEDAPPT